MTKRDERQKASDVFPDANFAFAEKVSFAEAFPEIADVRGEVAIGHAMNGNSKRVYMKAYLGEFIDCNNGLCYNGGFSIGEVIRAMVDAKATDPDGSAICRGYEGSPKGRRKYRDCLNHFRYTVHIDYVTPSPEVRGEPESSP